MTQEVLSLHPSGVWQEGTNHVRAHLRVADLLLPLHEQTRRWRPPPPSRSFGGVRFCTEKTRHEALCMHAGSVQAGCPEMQNGPCDADTVTVQPCTPSLCIAGCAHQEHRCLCAPLHTEHTASSTPARGPQHLGSPRARVQVSSGTTDLPVHPCTCNEHQGSPRASACVCRPHQESPYAPSHMQTATTDFFAHPYAPLHQHQGPPRTPLHVHPCDKDLPVHNCTYVPAPGISPCAPVCADQHHESPYAPLYVHTSTRTSPCNSACAHQHQRSPSGPLHVHSSTRDLSVHPCMCTLAPAPQHQAPPHAPLHVHPCNQAPPAREPLHQEPSRAPQHRRPRRAGMYMHTSTGDFPVQGCTGAAAPGTSLRTPARTPPQPGTSCTRSPAPRTSPCTLAHTPLDQRPLRATLPVHPWSTDLPVHPSCTCTPAPRGGRGSLRRLEAELTPNPSQPPTLVAAPASCQKPDLWARRLRAKASPRHRAQPSANPLVPGLDPAPRSPSQGTPPPMGCYAGVFGLKGCVSQLVHPLCWSSLPN